MQPSQELEDGVTQLHAALMECGLARIDDTGAMSLEGTESTAIYGMLTYFLVVWCFWIRLA
jgi:hypothetical protein